MKKLITTLLSILLITASVSPISAAEITVSNFLGIGGMGSEDGNAKTARFNRPSDVTVDSNGNAYVVDLNGIRKIDIAGNVTTIYKSINSDANSSNCGIATDKNNDLWFSDCKRSKLYKISNTGRLLKTVNLSSGQSSWMTLSPGVAALPDGSILVTMWLEGKVLKVSPEGSVSTYIQNSISGSCNTYPKPSGLICPTGITASPTGEVYILNLGASGNEVLKVNTDSSVSKVISANNPTVVKYLNNGLYVSSADYTVTKDWQLYRSYLNSSSQIVTSFADPNRYNANGFAFIDSKTLLLTSWDNNVIRKIDTATGVQTLIGNTKFGSDDGALSSATTQSPSGIVEDTQGNLYFLDYNGIRKIATNGVVTTLYKTINNSIGSIGFYNQKIFFIESNVLSSVDLNGNLQKIANVNITGDYPVLSNNSLSIDKNGQIYVVMSRNNDYSTKYVRKYDQTGTFKDLSQLFQNNVEVKILVDQNDALVIASNGQIKRYVNDILSSGNVIGSYFGWNPTLATYSSNDIMVFSRNESTAALNIVRQNGLTENIVNGKVDSSINAGANSGFGYIYGMLTTSNNKVYLSDSNNNTIREVKLSSTTAGNSTSSNTNSNINANLRTPRTASSWSRPSGLLAGLSEVRYKGYFKDNPQFFNDTAERTSISKTNSKQLPIWFDSTEMGTDMSIYWGGYFIPDQSGTWDFQITSDDASFLWIGNDAVSKYWYGVSSALIGLPGDHGPQTTSKSMRLEANKIYPFRIFYGNYGGPAGTFKLEVKPPAYKTSWDTNLEGLIWHSDFSDQEDCTNFGISYILSAKLGYDVIDVPACKNNPAKIFANGISSGTPVRPQFKSFNVTGNTLNLNVNIGEGANKPDKVYLVAPQLGINLRDANSAGQISGSTATWSIPLTSALLGKSLQLQFLSNRDGVDSDTLVRSIAIPNNSKSTSKNSAAPLSAINPKYSISGAKILLSAKLQVKPNSNAISGYLISPENGLTYNNSILGKINGNTINFIIPILPNMLGKKLKTEIYLVNEIGESKPLYVTIAVPAPKQPAVVIPTEKVKTVICKKGKQARTFAGTKCPPGWN